MYNGSDFEDSSQAHDLNVVNINGVWALLRDQLIAKPIAGLPRWLILDFVRIRGELHVEDGDGELDVVYSRLAKQYPELDPQALEQLEELERSLRRRCSAQACGTASPLSPYTKSFFSDETISFFQLYGGAIERCVRDESRPAAAYKLGASLTGPLFFGYVHKLMRQAVADGVTCLYFLARDGQILLEIAKIIKSQLGFDLELRYLYVSRNATRFASLLRLGNRDLEWIFEDMDINLSFATVASRLQMAPKELRTALRAEVQSQFVAIADDTKLKSSLIDTLRHELQSNCELAAAIEAGAAAVRQNVLGYFRQEGLFDLDHVALVDVGWKGTLQDAIYRIMGSEAGCPRLTEYYFGTSAYSQDTSPLNRKIPFFLFPSGKPGYGPLVELLLLADHGMTLSYECDGQSHYRAVTKEAGAHLADWGLSDYFDGIRDFSRLFAQSLSDYGTLFELHYDAAVPFLLDRFGSAEQSAAEILGDLPYCGNQEESYLRRMAPPFSAMDALKFICLPTQGRRDMTQWLEATYTRSGWSARLILHCDPRLVLSAGGKALLAPRNGAH